MIAKVGTKVSTPKGEGKVLYGGHRKGKEGVMVEVNGLLYWYADDDPQLQVVGVEEGE